VYRPDGGKFLTFVERGTLAEEESRRAAAERQRAEEESRRAAAERQRAEEEFRRAAKLAARLRELGIDPDSV
jgi:membrane protein involved in colicin uptake